MNPSTAYSRLRKNLLFHLVQRLNEDTCWRCHQRIESAADLSIDHADYWEGISADLFWDLNNIRWSHLTCNVGTTRRKLPTAPDGEKLCQRCRTPKPTTQFHRLAASKDGLYKWCKTCRKESDKRTSHRTGNCDGRLV